MALARVVVPMVVVETGVVDQVRAVEVHVEVAGSVEAKVALGAVSPAVGTVVAQVEEVAATVQEDLAREAEVVMLIRVAAMVQGGSAAVAAAVVAPTAPELAVAAVAARVQEDSALVAAAVAAGLVAAECSRDRNPHSQCRAGTLSTPSLHGHRRRSHQRPIPACRRIHSCRCTRVAQGLAMVAAVAMAAAGWEEGMAVVPALIMEAVVERAQVRVRTRSRAGAAVLMETQVLLAAAEVQVHLVEVAAAATAQAKAVSPNAAMQMAATSSNLCMSRQAAQAPNSPTVLQKRRTLNEGMAWRMRLQRTQTI